MLAVVQLTLSFRFQLIATEIPYSWLHWKTYSNNFKRCWVSLFHLHTLASSSSLLPYLIGFFPELTTYVRITFFEGRFSVHKLTFTQNNRRSTNLCNIKRGLLFVGRKCFSVFTQKHFQKLIVFFTPLHI
jgi:hypothetical protein